MVLAEYGHKQPTRNIYIGSEPLEWVSSYKYLGIEVHNDGNMFVCFITKSFLTYSFIFHLHLLYQPYIGLCQAQCVQSHQRQPMSAVAITACEVQVSAADSQTVPTVATGV